MNKYTKTLKTKSDKLKKNLSKLKFEDSQTKLILCYIPTCRNFQEIINIVKKYFEKDKTTIIATSTAGGLCSCNLDKNLGNIYINDENEEIVLQSFSADMLRSVETVTISLKNEDLRNQTTRKEHTKRVEEIYQEIEKKEIKTNINYNNTLAFTLIDGLSMSESFFLEAIYKTNKFPCQLVGGSSATCNLDNKTFIYNNGEILEDVAVIVLMKFRPNIKFGILKSQNFKKQNLSFEIVEASSARRIVKRVMGKHSSTSTNIIDYLCNTFNCKEDELEKQFLKYAFGIIIDGEYYIRSVANVDLENRSVKFYCDIDFGDELHLFKVNDFAKQTENDYKEFLKDKPREPFGGILNDCILRRTISKNSLTNLKCFDNIAVAGFSTFGELLGVNINQTLTAIFFFETISKNETFQDKYINNFINNYANFKLFFKERKLKALESKKIKQNYTEIERNQKNLKNYANKITNLLDNASQGFLLFKDDLLVNTGYSKESEKLLEPNLLGKNIAKLLFPDDEEKQVFFKDIISDVENIDDKTVQDSLFSLLPNIITLHRRAIKLEYKLLHNKEFMLILTNVTSQVKLEEKVKKEQKILKMIVTIVSDKNVFFDTKKDYEKFIDQKLDLVTLSKPPTYNLNKLYRIVHTFKGAFLQLFMVNTVNYLHNVESSISCLIESQSTTNDDILGFLNGVNFKSFIEQDMQIIKKMLEETFFEDENHININQTTARRIKEETKQYLQNNPNIDTTCKQILLEVEKITSTKLIDMLCPYTTMSYQLAQRLNKEIYEFDVRGDRDILIPSEDFVPFLRSLIHVFRNAVAHGIEDPETRLLKKKDDIGSINCDVKLKNNYLYIMISDDGAGIDVEKIKEKLVEKSVNIDDLEKDSIYSYIFENNFSTAQEITDMSGRGYGMSAVKDSLESINGTFKILSKKDEGTVFIFKIPYEQGI